MTADAINKVASMAQAAHPIVLAPDHSTTGRYYLRAPDGSLLQPDYPPVAPEFEVQSTIAQTTISLVRRIAADMRGSTGAREVQLQGIYIMPDQIEARLRSTAQRWTHRMDLPTHPVFAEISALRKPRTFTQRDLIHWLRSTMNGHVPDGDVEQFRALRITSDGATDTIVAKGHEGVDRRIAATIRQQTGTSLPDTLTVAVPVYDVPETAGELHPVDVLVDVRAGDSGPEFVLTAVHDGLRRAQRDAAAIMLDRLRAAIDGDGDDMVSWEDTYEGRVVA